MKGKNTMKEFFGIQNLMLIRSTSTAPYTDGTYEIESLFRSDDSTGYYIRRLLLYTHDKATEVIEEASSDDMCFHTEWINISRKQAVEWFRSKN